jgi:hypothetical protein
MRAKEIIVLSIALCFSRLTTGAADFPPIIQKGVAEYERSGAILAFNAWERGGLLEGENGTPGKLRAFKETTDALGSYLSAEKITTKPIGRSSQILYAALNFKRGAVYMKFWLYRGEGGWVVQNFVFSTRPEALMPWLAIEGDSPVAEQ